MLLLLAVLSFCDDAAEAGAAYGEAQKALAEERYEEGIHKLQEALRLEPRETDKLIYRNREGRQKLEYYPHYLWSRMRASEARSEKNPQLRIQLLREALAHLELSAHPLAKGGMGPLRAELDATLNAAALAPDTDSRRSLLRSEILALADRERFEEALQVFSREKTLLDQSPGDRDVLLETVEARRRSVLVRYDHAMTLALESLAVGSPVDRPEGVLPLLEAALVPSSVLGSARGQVVWLHGFLELYRRNLGLLRRSGSAELSEVLSAAQAFDESAASALGAGSPAGFRAASHVADALRETRLAGSWGRGQDASVERLLNDASQALEKRRERLLQSSVPLDERKRYLAEILAALLRSHQDSWSRLQERRGLEKQLEDWLGLARSGLSDSSTMSDPQLLKDRVQQEIQLEKQPRWEEIPPTLEAAVLFTRSLLDLVAGILNDDLGESLRNDIGARIRKARTLDPGVADAWKDRLSPKLQSLLPPRVP